MSKVFVNEKAASVWGTDEVKRFIRKYNSLVNFVKLDKTIFENGCLNYIILEIRLELYQEHIMFNDGHIGLKLSLFPGQEDWIWLSLESFIDKIKDFKIDRKYKTVYLSR